MSDTNNSDDGVTDADTWSTSSSQPKPRPKPVCSKCQTEDSLMWRKLRNGEIVCNNCPDVVPEVDKTDTGSNSNGSTVPRQVRKSARSVKGAAAKKAVPAKTPGPKGKSRRGIFKKSCMKAPPAIATVMTAPYVFYKGSYFQIGDIVSMLDVNGDTYYAQIYGLLQDQYCEKSAVVTWLLPTESSPEPSEGFDPSTYIIGPTEEIPRKLESMNFIMHAPSDYFKVNNSPYPVHPPSTEAYRPYISVRLKPKMNDDTDTTDTNSQEMC